MKIYKNIIFIMFVLILVILLIYIFITHIIINNSRQIYYSPDKNYFLSISYKDSLMAFGSGHKVLRLYNDKYIMLGKNTYGEHPLKIINWDENSVTILIESSYRENDNYFKYICNWIEGNKKVGRFNIKYIIKTRDREEVF